MGMFGLMLILARPAHSQTPVPCRHILESTIESVGKIKTLKFHLKCLERIKGKLLATESQVKMNATPRKIYVYLKGPELLWIEGKNNGNALVNPGGFPYMNLNLDPMGNIMRESQHHTIHEVGFRYFSGIIKKSLELPDDQLSKIFSLTGDITWEGRECYFITAEYPGFEYRDYQVQAGETLVSIAKKFFVSDYMLIEKNRPKVKSYNDVKAGQIIKVPNAYGKKMIIYIDKLLMLPRVIKVYDEVGLFESYEYHELMVNPVIPEEEFQKNFKGYGF